MHFESFTIEVSLYTIGQGSNGLPPVYLLRSDFLFEKLLKISLELVRSLRKQFSHVFMF